jgi:hypothetical protein
VNSELSVYAINLLLALDFLLRFLGGEETERSAEAEEETEGPPMPWKKSSDEEPNDSKDSGLAVTFVSLLGVLFDSVSRFLLPEQAQEARQSDRKSGSASFILENDALASPIQ